MFRPKIILSNVNNYNYTNCEECWDVLNKENLNGFSLAMKNNSNTIYIY